MGVVIVGTEWVNIRGVWWRESRDGGGAEIHFQRGDVANRFMGNGVISETDALGKRRPSFVVSRGEKFHRAIPIAPPTFNFSVALGIMPAGCRACGARGDGDV